MAEPGLCEAGAPRAPAHARVFTPVVAKPSTSYKDLSLKLSGGDFLLNSRRASVQTLAAVISFKGFGSLRTKLPRPGLRAAGTCERGPGLRQRAPARVRKARDEAACARCCAPPGSGRTPREKRRWRRSPGPDTVRRFRGQSDI